MLKSRVHGTIQRTTRMPGVRCAGRSRPNGPCRSLAAAAFLPATGQCNVHRRRIRISPEPASRHGLSLAHNDAFATIKGSTFPTCAFDATRKNIVNPFDLQLSRSIRFRGRYRAMSSPETRFPRRISMPPRFRRSPLAIGPLRLCRDRPTDRSVQPFPPREARLAETPDSPFAPRRAFFR